MPAPLPKSKFIQLLEELNRLAQEGASLSGMSLQRFKREAKSIMKASPPDGYLLLGILAGFEGDAKEMHCFHKLAIQLSADDPQYRRNYTASLLNFRFLQEALTFSRMTYEQSTDPGTKVDALDTMIKANDLLGNEDELLRLCDEYEALSGQVHQIVRAAIDDESTDEAAKVLMSGSTPEITPQGFVKIGNDLLSKVDRLVEDVRD